MLDTAQEQLDRVTEVTKQALLFHRESSQSKGLFIPEVFDFLLNLHRGALEDKSISISRIDRQHRELICMAGDIRQVLAHVLGNALDALSPGGILFLRVRDSEAWGMDHRKGIRITIADNGKGISPQTLPRIFEPFFTTKRINGNGLGLWITKDIITRHRGFVRVKSSTRPGQSGTVFQIFISHP